MLQCNMDAGDNVVPLREAPRSSEPEPRSATDTGHDAAGLAWSAWRRWFDAWEGATSRALEHGLRNPWLLEPGGAMLTGMMKLKSLGDRWVDAWWSSFGLATRREQERTLYELNRLHSRLLDLEERREHGEEPPP